MELAEAISARKSIRGFQPKPVPRPVIESILGLAARSPSWSNTQPWEVIVIGGEVMAEVKAALVQAVTSGTPAAPEIPLPGFADPYLNRRRDLGIRLYQALGISREDRDARDTWSLQGYRFFEAPIGLIFCLDAALGTWSVLDLGMFLQSVMLAALSFGLGTCATATVVHYPDVLRQILGIPERQKIICGMAIGYPDWQHPANRVESQRETVAGFTRWCGV